MAHVDPSYRRSHLRLWRGETSEPPPPGPGGPTLSDVLALWVQRVRVPEGAELRTLEKDRAAVGLFDAVLDSPPVEQLDGDWWAEYLERLRLVRVRGKPLSEATVRGHAIHCAAILRYAGAGGRRGDGLRLSGSFYLPIPPARQSDEARTPYSDYDCERLFALAEGEPPEFGRVRGKRAADWWLCLLALAYNTGLRPISLFNARREWIGRNRPDWLWLPPRALKHRRHAEEFYLNGAAQEAIARLGTGRSGLVLPLTASEKPAFYRAYARLEAAAGVQGQANHKLRRFRQYLATWLAPRSLAAAKYVLGHATGDVLLEHYARRYDIVPPLLDALPQPGAPKQLSLF